MTTSMLRLPLELQSDQEGPLDWTPPGLERLLKKSVCVRIPKHSGYSERSDSIAGEQF